MYIHIYMCVYIHIYVYIHVCVYIYIYIYTYVCIYIHTFMHTYATSCFPRGTMALSEQLAHERHEAGTPPLLYLIHCPIRTE